MGARGGCQKLEQKKVIGLCRSFPKPLEARRKYFYVFVMICMYCIYFSYGTYIFKPDIDLSACCCWTQIYWEGVYINPEMDTGQEYLFLLQTRQLDDDVGVWAWHRPVLGEQAPLPAWSTNRVSGASWGENDSPFGLVAGLKLPA